MNTQVDSNPPRMYSALMALFSVAAIFSALNYQGHNYTYRWNMLALFILLVLTVVTLFRQYPKSLKLNKQYALMAYGLFMLWACLSLFWSAVPSDSLLHWLTQLTAVFALFLGYQSSEIQWRDFKKLLLLLLLAVVCYTLYQSQVLDISRPAGFMLNWNSNAAFIALLMLPVCATFLQVETGFQRLMLGVVLMGSVVAIVVCQSRGGLLVLMVGIVPMIWVHVRQTKQMGRIMQLVLYLIIGYMIAEWLQGGVLSRRVTSQLGQVATDIQANEGGEVSTKSIQNLGSGRYELWKAGWQMHLDKPVLGWGLGLYHWLYTQYRDPFKLELGQMAHNDYLDTLIALGPVGVFLLILFVISVAYLLWRSIRAKNIDNIALSAGSLGVLLHSFVSFNLSQSAIIMVVGFFVGYSTHSLSNKTELTAKPQSFDKSLYYGLVGGMGLMCSLWLGSLFMGFRQAEMASHVTHPSQRIALLNKAQNWTPYMESYDALEAAIVIDMLKGKIPKELTDEGHRVLVDHALKKVNDALFKNPLRALSHRNKAELLEARAKTEAEKNEVVSAYKNVLLLDPYDLDARFRLTEFLEAQGREVEAYNILFDGFDKTYFAELKVGIGFLMKVQKVLETTILTTSQEEKLKSQMETLVTLMMRYKKVKFVLKDIGISRE